MSVKTKIIKLDVKPTKEVLASLNRLDKYEQAR